MLKMRLEAQSRRRRAMNSMSTAGGAPGPADDLRQNATSSDHALARMARGELFDEEECLTDDEQLDVLPG